jgi:hypothetical protein
VKERKLEDHKAELYRLKLLRNAKANSRRDKIFEVPGDVAVAWTAKPCTLLRARVWRSLGIYERRALDALEVEHCAHAGRENGYLILTFDTALDWGIPYNAYKRTMARLCDLKLVEQTHKGRYRGGAKLDPNLYRLTYLPHALKGATGAPLYFFPTHDWIDIEVDLIEGRRRPLREKRHAPPTRKNQFFTIKNDSNQPIKNDSKLGWAE